MNHKKKEKSNSEQQQFEFCEVCRLNHNRGRCHNYLPSHKNSLSDLLSRFQLKISMSNSSSKLRCLSSRSTLRSVSGVSSAIAIFSSSIANSLVVMQSSIWPARSTGRE